MLIEFTSFLRFRVKGQKRFECCTCGFESQKKSVFKNIRVRVDKAFYLIWLFCFFNRINFFKTWFCMIYDKKTY